MGSLGMEGDEYDQPLQVVMFPSLAFGHIFPFVQLSNILAANGIKVTFLAPPSLVPRIRVVLDPHIPIVNYKLPPVDGLPSDVDSTNGNNQVTAELLAQALDLARPQIAKILVKLSPQVVIFDFVQSWVPEVAQLLGIKSLYFSIAQAFSLVTAILCGQTPRQRPSLTRLRLPPRELLSMYLTMKPYDIRGMLSCTNGSGRSPSHYNRLISSMAHSDAIAVKSSYETEAPQLKYLSSRCKKPLLPIGMLLPKAPTGEIEPKFAEWLNKFPKGTVVFCAFGSESYLAVKQMKELVAGLEMSGFPFLAVINTPADMPKAKKQEVEAEILGEKAGGRGMVQSGWMNQRLILRHPAVGCFICHSGYGSVMEAVEAGCQLILLPLKADQCMVMKMMVVQMRAAVTINRRAWDGWFIKKAIRKAVRTVMVEGSKKGMVARENMAKLRDILLKEGLQEGYTKGLITMLKQLAASP